MMMMMMTESMLRSYIFKDTGISLLMKRIFVGEGVEFVPFNKDRCGQQGTPIGAV
jgi:hypothetical protein